LDWAQNALDVREELEAFLKGNTVSAEFWVFAFKDWMQGGDGTVETKVYCVLQ
jgi:hypothetical protein